MLLRQAHPLELRLQAGVPVSITPGKQRYLPTFHSLTNLFIPSPESNQHLRINQK